MIRISSLPIPRRLVIALFSLMFLSSAGLHAQASQPGADVVVFLNGEKLVGHLESFGDGKAKFKSDALGELTIDLSKVQELHAVEKFAVIVEKRKTRQDWTKAAKFLEERSR